jgi:hypothetical protein
VRIPDLHFSMSERRCLYPAEHLQLQWDWIFGNDMQFNDWRHNDQYADYGSHNDGYTSC